MAAIEPTIGMVNAFFDALPGLRSTPDVRADVGVGLAAVLAIVERDYCLEAKGHVYHPLAKHVEPSVEDWEWPGGHA